MRGVQHSKHFLAATRQKLVDHESDATLMVMKKYLLTAIFIYCSTSMAFEIGSWRLDGHVSVGHNSAAGTYGLFGVDLYTIVADYTVAGLGAYYAAGEHPDRDREMGAGPFVAVGYPIFDFLIANAREDVDYVDSHYPYIVSYNPTTWDYISETGFASITSLGLTLKPFKSFSISGGYRLALALNNSDLARDRSGWYLGLGFSF